MLLRDFVVLKGINPVKLVKIPSNETWELLKNLIHSKGMGDFIISIRKQYNLPENGLDIKKFIGINLYDIGDVNINAFKLLTNEFVRSTGLPEEYTLELFLAVMFNAIIDLRYFKHEPSDPKEFVFGRRRIADKMWGYDHEVGAIIVPFDVSKTTLKKWIDKNWDLITDEMDNNFTNNPFILRIHNNLIYEEEINNLKEKEEKTFSEILIILREKYVNENWTLSRVKKIYYDMKQREALQRLSQQHNTQTP